MAVLLGGLGICPVCPSSRPRQKIGFSFSSKPVAHLVILGFLFMVSAFSEEFSYRADVLFPLFLLFYRYRGEIYNKSIWSAPMSHLCHSPPLIKICIHPPRTWSMEVLVLLEQSERVVFYFQKKPLFYMDSSHTRPESRKKKRNSIRDEKEKESTLRED